MTNSSIQLPKAHEMRRQATAIDDEFLDHQALIFPVNFDDTSPNSCRVRSTSKTSYLGS